MKVYKSYRDIKSDTNFEVELDINIDEIAQTFAARAFHSKHKTSTGMQRAIKCRVMKPDEPK